MRIKAACKDLQAAFACDAMVLKCMVEMKCVNQFSSEAMHLSRLKLGVCYDARELN